MKDTLSRRARRHREMTLAKFGDAAGLVASIVGISTSNPWLAPVVSTARLAINTALAIRLNDYRARRVIDAVLKDPDHTLLEMMFRKRTYPDREALLREMRLRLQDIADAIDDSVVDPLISVMQRELKGDISARVASQLVAILKPLDATEVADLRQLMSDALKVSSDELIGLISWFDSERGDTSTTGVGAGVGREGKWVSVTDCGSSLRLFRLLRSSELAVAAGTATSADLISGRPQEVISMHRRDVELLARLLSS